MSIQETLELMASLIGHKISKLQLKSTIHFGSKSQIIEKYLQVDYIYSRGVESGNFEVNKCWDFIFLKSGERWCSTNSICLEYTVKNLGKIAAVPSRVVAGQLEWCTPTRDVPLCELVPNTFIIYKYCSNFMLEKNNLT